MELPDTPEQLLALLLEMRATQDAFDARLEVRICLEQVGQVFDEDYWSTFFDPEETFANAMYDLGQALWELEWPKPDGMFGQAALLAFEAAKGAGLVIAGYALAQSLDWVADERAEEALRDFVMKNPDWEDPRLYGILGGLVANLYDSEEHMWEALGFLERVGDTEPLWIQWRALAIAKLGRRDEAIALLDEQVRADDRDALRVLGDVHLASGDRSAACDAYGRAVAVGDEIAARRLGFRFRENGDESASVQAFAIAAERGDAFSVVELRDIGWALRDEGRVEEAIAQFRLAWEIGDAEAGRELAVTLEQSGVVDEAKAVWKVVADGGHVNAMINVGEWAHSDRDLPVAREYFRRAIEQGTSEERALAAGHLGTTYNVTVASEDGVDVQALLERGADSLPGARAALGWLHACAGRAAEAVGVWAAGMGRGELDSIASLGAWNMRGADPDGGVVLVERALAGATTGIMAYNLGSSLDEAGEQVIAARFMERAVALDEHVDAGEWLAARG